jgi:hypothetical protein
MNFSTGSRKSARIHNHFMTFYDVKQSPCRTPDDSSGVAKKSFLFCAKKVVIRRGTGIVITRDFFK